MNRPAPHRFTVLSAHNVTPHLRRVTLGGAGMATFPVDQASAYVKLLLPAPDGGRPLLRTYTVRAQRQDAIDIDFALHGDDGGGPASRWALRAVPGDTIEVAGPGPKKLVAADADRVLLVGDLTALPAISANLEQLPDAAVGRAVIEIPDAADQQYLKAPPGVLVQWVVNPTPGRDAAPLHDAIAALDWPDGRVAVWAACEFASMRALRAHFREVRAVDRHDLYISSYWKQGSDETTHKAIKRADAEREAA